MLFPMWTFCNAFSYHHHSLCLLTPLPFHSRPPAHTPPIPWVTIPMIDLAVAIIVGVTIF